MRHARREVCIDCFIQINKGLSYGQYKLSLQRSPSGLINGKEVAYADIGEKEHGIS